ncbi:MAG: PepSY-like domain-containing protein [Saprospiraceae bacterium]
MKSFLFVKSYLFLLPFLLLSSKPPEAVLNAFDKKFPDAAEVKWSKEGDHNFVANFFMDDKGYSALFSDKGKWISTEIPIEFEELPQKVQDNFNKSYDPGKIKAIYKIEPSSGKLKYEIEIKKLIKTQALLFSDTGKEIKK